MFIEYLNSKYIKYFIFYLNFDIKYNVSIRDNKNISSLPLINITKLYLYDKFNQNIDFISNLPLKILKLGNYFDHSIHKLSESRNLKKLKIGNSFNQPIDDILPKNLKVLSLGYKFNQSVDHLPLDLKELTLGYCFNQPINHLPQNLRILDLENSIFNQSIN